MNYLGHAVLSPTNNLATLGNLSGDFLKNHLHPQLSQPLLQGVVLHRKIDSITDNHPAFKFQLPLLRPHFGKYSGVVLDVLLDHVLCTVWDRLFEDKFQDFSSEVYRAILNNLGYLPDHIASIMAKMATAEWLAAYSEESRMLGVFNRLSIRAAKELDGKKALAIFELNREIMQELSLELVVDLKEQLIKQGYIASTRIKWMVT